MFKLENKYCTNATYVLNTASAFTLSPNYFTRSSAIERNYLSELMDLEQILGLLTGQNLLERTRSKHRYAMRVLNPISRFILWASGFIIISYYFRRQSI